MNVAVESYSPGLHECIMTTNGHNALLPKLFNVNNLYSINFNVSVIGFSSTTSLLLPYSITGSTEDLEGRLSDFEGKVRECEDKLKQVRLKSS